MKKFIPLVLALFVAGGVLTACAAPEEEGVANSQKELKPDPNQPTNPNLKNAAAGK
jgi:hypothetical protein